MKGVIFDFNGTMFFDTPIQEEAWQRIMEREIGRRLTNDEFKQKLHGRNNEQILKIFVDENISDSETKRIINDKESLYRQLCLSEFKEDFHLAKGLEKLLDMCEKSGIKRCIATASDTENVEFYTKNLGLDRWFSKNDIMCNDGTLPSKPNPQIYLKAIQKSGLPTDELYVVEDAILGITAAHNAKVEKIIAITSGSKREYFEKSGMVWDVIDDYENFFEKYFK